MKHLDRIPDPDLRLFAHIELCAALAGLPQLGGLTTQHCRRPRIPTPAELDQIFGSVLPGIRCPLCKWSPRTNNLWSCKCGHHWNTFHTRGLCPECSYQWEVTGCLQCQPGNVSAPGMVHGKVNEPISNESVFN